MDKIFVSKLEDKQAFFSTFLAKNKLLLTDKKGKNYMSLLLSDSTGDIDARAWDNIDQMEGVFQSGDVIKVKGTVQTYQNRKQVVVHKIERFEGEVKPEDYMTTTEVSPEVLFQKLLSIISSVESQNIKQLLESAVTDPSIKPLLLRAPAAKSVHHAKIGGLIEHMVSVSQLADLVCKNYSFLNRDLVIFGAIMHDFGKVWELKISDKGIQYTTQGRLIGHMVMAVEMIEKKTSQIFNFPQDLKDICKHIILSHHGKLEYGSPKLPHILEAYVVWMLDELDSKVDAISQALNVGGSEEGWSNYSSLFERPFYKMGKKWE